MALITSTEYEENLLKTESKAKPPEKNSQEGEEATAAQAFAATHNNGLVQIPLKFFKLCAKTTHTYRNTAPNDFWVIRNDHDHESIA